MSVTSMPCTKNYQIAKKEIRGSKIVKASTIYKKRIYQLSLSNIMSRLRSSVSNWSKEEIPFKSLQMNDHALERFDLRIASGQSFSPSDYQYNRDKIPVILGNSYSDYYTIGDKIQLSYLFKQFDAEVIGFVEKR